MIPGFRRLPIIYHDWYNLEFTKTLKGRHHLIKLPDKPACAYSLLESMLCTKHNYMANYSAENVFAIFIGGIIRFKCSTWTSIMYLCL